MAFAKVFNLDVEALVGRGGRQQHWREPISEDMFVYRFALFVLLVAMSCHPSLSPSEGKELIGEMAPAWQPMAWINSPPLSLEELNGKVVLLRWWVDRCRFCVATAPSLNYFHQQYASEGLVVIGIYHPKPYPGPVGVEAVEMLAAEKGFEFPVALDEDWANLKRYWLDGGRRTFTSVSFLIDRSGIIRHIHPGGEYHADGVDEHAGCRDDFLEMEAWIKRLL